MLKRSFQGKFSFLILELYFKSSSNINMNLGKVQRGRNVEINTFTKRPVFTQIIAYLTVAAEFLVFTICIQANIANQAHQIILMVLYYLSFLSMVTAWVVTSKTNPSDSLLNRSHGEIIAQFPDRLLLYCQKCRKIVQQASLHCKICDTCVENFDHHCIWINNCIGSKNYRVFIAMIVSITINFLLYLTATAILWFQGNWENFWTAMITVWVTFGIVTIFTCLLLALVAFHTYLIVTGKTTYKFFMQKKGAKVAPAPQFCTQNLAMDAQINRNSVNQMKLNYLNRTQIEPSKSNDPVLVDKESRFVQRDHEQSLSECQQSKQKESCEKQSEKEGSISIESKPSQTISQMSIIRRNRSIDYIIGRFCVDEQSRSSQRLQSSYKSLKHSNISPHPKKMKPLGLK